MLCTKSVIFVRYILLAKISSSSLKKKKGVSIFDASLEQISLKIENTIEYTEKKFFYDVVDWFLVQFMLRLFPVSQFSFSNSETRDYQFLS